MSQAQRTTREFGIQSALQPGTHHQYEAGGHIAAVQANLARQLHEHDTASGFTPMSPAERLTQSCSRTGGYGLLGLGYTITSVMILRWL